MFSIQVLQQRICYSKQLLDCFELTCDEVSRSKEQCSTDARQQIFPNPNIWQFLKCFGILRGMIWELLVCQQRRKNKKIFFIHDLRGRARGERNFLVDFFLHFFCKFFSSTLYRGSPPYADFGTWKKPCYMKFVLVGLQ